MRTCVQLALSSASVVNMLVPMPSCLAVSLPIRSWSPVIILTEMPICGVGQARRKGKVSSKPSSCIVFTIRLNSRGKLAAPRHKQPVCHPGGGAAWTALQAAKQGACTHVHCRPVARTANGRAQGQRACKTHLMAPLNGLLGVVAGRVKQGHQAHHLPAGTLGGVLCGVGTGQARAAVGVSKGRAGRAVDAAVTPQAGTLILSRVHLGEQAKQHIFLLAACSRASTFARSAR